MATDLVRARVVMFGGGAFNYRDDHWEWDGSSWSAVRPAIRPPARANAAMVFDSNRQRLVLFGGVGGSGYLDDTWEYDGTTWRLAQAVGPSARHRSGMAFDAARGVTVLFGGDSTTISNETWTWNGIAWVRMAGASPPGRSGAPLAYDSARSRVVMFGGFVGSNNLADTWEWDGSAWNQRFPPVSPPPRSAHMLSFDPVRGRTVLVGGNVNYPRQVSDGSAWEWDGVNWVQQAAPPTAMVRESAGATFDPVQGRTLIVQGITEAPTGSVSIRTDCWDWNGSSWRLRHDAAHPPARQADAFAWARHEGSASTVLFGGTLSNNILADTWQWDGNVWSRRQPPTSPPARRWHGMATDRRNDQVVLFGGSASAVFGDTWVWTGNNWVQQSVAVAPPARRYHLMTWDSVRNVVLLHGGSNTSTVHNDLWEWNGTAWTQRFPVTSPPLRENATLAFDDARGQAVLFGGWGASGHLADTWLWNGVDWSQAQPVTSPPARVIAAMAYDAARQRVVLHGGLGPLNQRRSDTWEWDGVGWTQRVLSAGPDFDNLGKMVYEPTLARCLLFDGEQLSLYGPVNPASATAFGSACAGPAGAPALQATALPWMGDLCVVAATNLPSGTMFVALIAGISDTSWNGRPLPTAIPGTGSPGCLLWSSIDATMSMTLQGTSASHSFAMPTTANVLGFEFFQQAAAFDPTWNAAGPLTTNPVRLVVGSR